MGEKKTPEAWCDQYGLEVHDADGWSADHTPWTEPLTLPEFWRRYGASTAKIPTGDAYDRVIADVRAAKREDNPAPSATTRHRVRIENRNPDGKKILSGGRITVDGEDISGHVLRADIHLDPRELPTAVLEVVDLDLDIEAELAVREVQSDTEAVTGELVAGADPILCAQCLAEQHDGTREEPNPARTIAGGNAACLDHILFAPRPIAPGRTPGGIILGNGS